MHIKIILFLIITLVFIDKSKAQNHFLGIKAGYTKSIPSKPDNQVSIDGDEITISEGVKRFKGLDGFQIGLYTFIDFGSDFYILILLLNTVDMASKTKKILFMIMLTLI